MRVLVLAQVEDGALGAETSRVLGAAAALGADVEVDVLVAGHGVNAAAEMAARLDGVTRVLVADSPALAYHLAEPMAALLKRLPAFDDYVVILGGMNAAHREALPRLAGMLGVMALTDVIGIEAPDTFRRPMFAGNIIAHARLLDTPRILLVRPAAFAPAAERAEAAPVEKVAVPDDLPRPAEVVAEERHDARGRPPLEQARIVLGMGRGAADPESRALLEQLAKSLGAAIAATRMVVDEGLAPNEWQVGQTGKTIAPALYMAFGISGAHQHLAGIRDAQIIAAVNTDAEAPIFKAADVGLVMDARTALQGLLKRIKSERGE